MTVGVDYNLHPIQALSGALAGSDAQVVGSGVEKCGSDAGAISEESASDTPSRVESLYDDLISWHKLLYIMCTMCMHTVVLCT